MIRSNRFLVTAAIATLAMSASAGGAPPSISLETPRRAPDGSGQPHGHSSSQGSTSNLRSKAEKKRRNKLAKKSRKQSRR